MSKQFRTFHGKKDIMKSFFDFIMRANISKSDTKLFRSNNISHESLFKLVIKFNIKKSSDRFFTFLDGLQHRDCFDNA